MRLSEDVKRTRELLAEVLRFGPGQIRRLYRDYPEYVDPARTIPKLEYMREHYSPDECCYRRQLHPCHFRFLLLTPEEFRFITEVPERMGFSEKETARYRRTTLFHTCTEDLRPLVPLLTELAGSEEGAWKAVRELYLSDFTLKSAEEIAGICRRLLSYPKPEDPILTNSFQAVELFSEMSDPLFLLDELDKRFVPEAILSIFPVELSMCAGFARMDPVKRSEYAHIDPDREMEYLRSTLREMEESYTPLLLPRG